MGNKKSSNLKSTTYQNAPLVAEHEPFSPPRSENLPDNWCKIYGLTFTNALKVRVEAVPLTLIKVNAEIKSFLASVTLTQFYKNIESDPIECEFVFPLDDDGVITDISIQLDDGREIKADIQPKHQAQEQYSDAIASGHSAMIARTNEPDRMILKVGNLAPNSKAKVTVKYITPLSVQNQHWRFIIPTSMTPMYPLDHHFSDEDIEETSTFNIVPAEACPYKIGFKIHLSTNSILQELKSPSHEVVINHGTDFKTASVALNPNTSYVPDRDFILSFITEDAFTPRAMIEDWEGKYTAMLSFIPKFLEREETIEDLEGSGEYILVIDRSGSMEGRISIAISAAVLFLRSLPIRSKFNIVSFGSKFEIMFETSQVYTKESMNKAIKRLQRFDADMGGTEILNPLMHIFDQPVNIEYPRTVFLLTDGEVGQPERVVRLVSEHVGKCRVHTIGIGAGVDSYLIKEAGKAGKGSYSFVTQNEELQFTVMNALKRAIQPCLTSWSINWNVDTVPKPDRMPTLYYNEPFVVFAKGDTLVNNEISLRAWNTKYNRWEDFSISPQEFYISKGDSLRKLWGKHKIRELEYALIKGEDVKTEIERLSMELKIPSSQTAYIAIEYRNDPVTGHLQHRDIPISTTVDIHVNSQESSISSQPLIRNLHPPPQSLPQSSSGQPRSSGKRYADKIPTKKERSKSSLAPRLWGKSSQDEFEFIPSSGYAKFIEIAELEGYWKLRSLKKVIEVPKSPESIDGLKRKKRIWATLVALAYLEKLYSENKNEWSLIAAKARRWLKSNHVEEDLFEAAERSIS